MPQPEVIADYACQTGERPLWHPLEKRLYWTDIPAGRMFRYDPATGRHEQVYQDRPVGGFTVQADGALLLFRDRGNVVVWRQGRVERTVVDEIPDERTTRFNDVIADPAGRVFCGTMSEKDAQGRITRFSRLYRLDVDGSLHPLVDGVRTSNGLGFSPDLKLLYYTETGAHTIWLFDYDAATGAIAGQRVFVKTPDAPGEGRPDGLAVDEQGHIWSARWAGGCVVRYSPDEVERERIALPTPLVSCPAFGGDDNAELYITTAGGHDRQANGPLAGALFRVRPGVRGGPQFFSRIALG
jgi:sugar lactone lactonase YvrE